MLAPTREWLDGLRDFAAEHRQKKRLTEPESADERAAERMILAAQLAGRFAAWDGNRGSPVAGESGEDGQTTRDPTPGIVITTSAVGIAAAAEQFVGGRPLLGALADRIAAVTELEYRLWCIRRPDDDYRWHVNVWNWIKKRVPPQRQAEFARHPLEPGDDYWLHRTGIAGAGQTDRRDCHLWRWNGRHASLLEAFVQERGVAEL